MTTISAGAAAGLLVALLVMSTGDGYGVALPAANQAAGFAHPGAIKGFNPQPDPPHEARGFDPQPDPPQVFGDGSVKPAGR